MPIPHGGHLNTANVNRFVKHLHEAPDHKRQAIDKLGRQGFRATVEEFFDLDDHQRDELQRTMDSDFEDVCGRAAVFALRKGGKIEFRHEGHDPPNMTAEVYCRGSAGPALECGVRFTC